MAVASAGLALKSLPITVKTAFSSLSMAPPAAEMPRPSRAWLATKSLLLTVRMALPNWLEMAPPEPKPKKVGESTPPPMALLFVKVLSATVAWPSFINPPP